MEEVAAAAGGEVVGRPHFAAVMVRKGHVRSTQEAFDRYLAKGQPAYMDKVRLSPEESIAAIRAAGGVAVLAHPLQLKAGSDEATGIHRLGPLQSSASRAWSATTGTTPRRTRPGSWASPEKLRPRPHRRFRFPRHQPAPHPARYRREENLKVPLSCWADWLGELVVRK